MRMALASLLVSLCCSGLAAAAAPAESVVVIRGTDVSHQSEGVVVMRPAEGSFLRETTRLAASADARERRAADKRARDADRRLASALETLASAAQATQSRFDDDYYHSHVWVMNSRPVPGGGNRTLPPVARLPVTPSPP